MSATTEERRVSRDRDPLKHRRVRNAEGRTGTIQSSTSATSLRVHWDDMDKPWHAEHVDGTTVEILAAPEIALPVFVRKVLFRGHKEQVAEYVAALAPLNAEAVAAGASRVVEFDPQPAAYRRWRLVYRGPALDPAVVRDTPDEFEHARSHRRALRDASYDDAYPDMVW